jgi:CRISPR system Cascade subunit CasB
MSKNPPKPDPFIRYLEEHRDDRAMLAALRRGVGQPPGGSAAVSKYVQPWLWNDAPASLEGAYYLIAPLFALHPMAGGTGNMGDHFAAMVERGQEPPPSVERRFMLLLSAHPDDLADYLRQAVGLLKSKDVPVDWQQLLKDVRAWKSRDERWRIEVQKEWARAFWRSPHMNRPADQPETHSTDSTQKGA